MRGFYMTRKERLEKLKKEAKTSVEKIDMGGYEGLANAVVLQSVNDYIKGSLSDGSFRRWLYSDRFALFTSLDPTLIYNEAVRKKSIWKEYCVEYARYKRDNQVKNRKLDNKGIKKSDWLLHSTGKCKNSRISRARSKEYRG